jgi:hypothetical protein
MINLRGEIRIQVINDDEYEKSEDFYVELETPSLVSAYAPSDHSGGSDAGFFSFYC